METRRRHRMPFGAELVEGGVRFRLWAPAAKTVDLVLQDRADVHPLPMHALEEGWFELTTNAAHAGSRYKFRINGRIDGDLDVPDPAARASEDVSGASIVVDPLAYQWRDS